MGKQVQGESSLYSHIIFVKNNFIFFYFFKLNIELPHGALLFFDNLGSIGQFPLFIWLTSSFFWIIAINNSSSLKLSPGQVQKWISNYVWNL